jgi:hypothetical protein
VELWDRYGCFFKSRETASTSSSGFEAEVERAVSAYNRIVTFDRTNLKDERISQFLKIYCNANVQRKEKNLKRSQKSYMKQKEKGENRDYMILNMNKPKKKEKK